MIWKPEDAAAMVLPVGLAWDLGLWPLCPSLLTHRFTLGVGRGQASSSFFPSCPFPLASLEAEQGSGKKGSEAQDWKPLLLCGLKSFTDAFGKLVKAVVHLPKHVSIQLSQT